MNAFYRLLPVAFCCLLLVALPRYARSQAMNGIIEGTVRSQGGPVLSGVNVGIRNQENGSTRSLRTDASGRYRAVLLPLGNYEILAGLQGYATTQQTGITLEVGQTATVNFTLRMVGTPETVNVTTRMPLIDADQKQPSTTLNRNFVQNLPLYGRKFMDLGILVPGATEFGDRDTSATGDFAGVNHFYSNALVDGVDAYQAWSNLPKGKFLVPFEFSESAIGEFQVLNGNFNAEFGRSAGGMINVVTKSGTNSWHGDGSYLFSDSGLNSTPRFAATKPKTRQHQFGVSVGGPLIRDRLFLFSNYDQTVRRDPLIVTSGTALTGFDSTLATITNPAEQTRFIQARDFVVSQTGNFDRDIDQYTYLARFDWRLNSAHSLSARLNFQHLDATNVPENGFNTPVISGMAVTNNGTVAVTNTSLALQWTTLLSPQIVNEARLHYTVGTEDQLPNGEGPQVRIGSARTGFAFGRRDVFPASLREQRWQWFDSITIVSGRHEFKAGVDIHRITDRNFGVLAASGSYQFNNLRDFANSRYMTFTQGFGVPEDTTVSPYYSVFFQDNVKLTSSLTMNAGLRYEYQGLKPTESPNPQFAQTAEAPSDKNNFAPRLSFAWQPLSKLVVRTSYGIYYGPLPIQVNSVAKTQNGVFQTLREFRGPNVTGAPIYPEVFPEDSAPQVPAAGARITAFSPEFASPYIQQVNVELEREVLADLSISSGWLYTKGTRLRSNVDMNLFPPGTRTYEIRDTASGTPNLVTLPYFGGPASRPFPFFDQISEFRSDNSSVYHAFFTQVKKRYSDGLQVLANYTLSKLIDRDPAPGNQTTCCSSENPFNPGQDRGLGRRDQRHRLNVAAVWDLPSVSSGNRVARSVFNGWRINTIAKVGSGRPFATTVTGDQGGDINGDGVRGDSAPLFSRGSFTGPGYATVDFGLHRVFTLEGKRIEVGWEAYNLFNRANYLRPVTDYFTLTNVSGGTSRIEGPLPSFGTPQDATRSREMQAVIKVYF